MKAVSTHALKRDQIWKSVHIVMLFISVIFFAVKIFGGTVFVAILMTPVGRAQIICYVCQFAAKVEAHAEFVSQTQPYFYDV